MNGKPLRIRLSFIFNRLFCVLAILLCLTLEFCFPVQETFFSYFPNVFPLSLPLQYLSFFFLRQEEFPISLLSLSSFSLLPLSSSSLSSFSLSRLSNRSAKCDVPPVTNSVEGPPKPGWTSLFRYHCRCFLFFSTNSQDEKFMLIVAGGDGVAKLTVHKSSCVHSILFALAN